MLILLMLVLALQHTHGGLESPSRIPPRKGMLITRLDVIDMRRRDVARIGIEAAQLVIVGGEERFGDRALSRLQSRRRRLSEREMGCWEWLVLVLSMRR